MLKKILALLLVVLMVLPAVVACNDNGDSPKQTINYETDDVGGGDSQEEDPLIGEIDEYIDELSSQYNFKGETFTWIGPNGWEAPERMRKQATP